jgi:choline-sulfatase
MSKTHDSARPNILFLFSDEHGFRYLSARDRADGGEPVDTPTLDSLIRGGTYFTDAYCQMPLCTPSRITVLTGKHVQSSGAWSNESVLRPELDTLPGAFSAAGYTTCLVGKMHLGGNRQFCGFDFRPYGDLTGKCGHQWEPIDDYERARAMRTRTAEAGVTGVPESLIQDEIVAAETVAFLREHAAASPEKPWFLCASFSRPHFPLTAPRRFIDKYTDRGIPDPFVPASGDAYDHPMSVGMRRGFMADAIDAEETRRARIGYFACVEYLDQVIGDLLARLDRDGLLDNTIIVYTTDHGEMAGEHGVWWKNGWYEACTRVPLIISRPEVRSGESPARVCRRPVGLVDLFPTLCSLTGVESSAEMEGRDLSATVISGDDPEDKPVFCDALQPRWGEGTEFRSIRYRQYKYVRFRHAPPLFFDLAADPGEQKNLIERGIPAGAKPDFEFMEQVAGESIDFDAAERDRTVRDGSLSEQYAQTLPPATDNLYLMPSGRLINADDTLYYPTVIVDTPEQAFGDFPGRLHPAEAD